MFVKDSDGFRAVAGFDHLIAMLLKRDAKDGSNCLFVIHDQNERRAVGGDSTVTSFYLLIRNLCAYRTITAGRPHRSFTAAEDRKEKVRDGLSDL